MKISLIKIGVFIAFFILLPNLSIAQNTDNDSDEYSYGEFSTKVPISDSTSERFIPGEVPGRIERITKYYQPDSAEIAFSSYATGSMPGCSAAMIGPNIMMTAAHCLSLDSLTFTNENYSERNIFNPVSESFTCHRLLETWWDSDIMLYYCDTPVGGYAPGDKFGYLDIDPTPVALNDSIYSIGWNHVTNLGIAIKLYSPGNVTSITDSNTYCPGITTGDPDCDHLGTTGDLPVGICSDVYGAGGLSGSPILSMGSHRIVSGPTSVGNAVVRCANSMESSMELCYLHSERQENFHDAYLNPLGFDRSTYTGILDKNKNSVFDIQEDMERLQDHGIANKPIFWLGFENRGRNALWSTSPLVKISFFPNSQSVGIENDQNGELWALMLSGQDAIHWKPNSEYRLTIMSYTVEAIDPESLHIFMHSPTAGEPPNSSHYLTTTPGTGWQTHSVTVWTGTAGDENLFISTVGTSKIHLAGLSLSERYGSVWDFDTHDARFAWKNENTGARALIVPDGKSFSGETGTDWAAVVWRDPSLGAYHSDWSLRNLRLGLQPNSLYRISFDVKRDPADPLTPSSATGAIRITTNGAEIDTRDFRLTDTWQTVTVRWLLTGSGSSNIMFGVNMATGGAYLVDNIQISGP